ncbi:hypothetical protein [Lignipirellula cremea]|uniref:Uncharacterized protein n=1 Tax=Lignipirellula cremea TaxID=2528010 RepID=A0A518DZ72_9BACT|nr:hypothetical protein [Lignipirellula cremea]QDU97132.1 hypothetical protein Pla8534_49770 [Lignipirellula cremea]
MTVQHRGKRASERQESQLPLTAAGENSGPIQPIARIALVSHDYTQECRSGLYDYSEDFAAINAACDAAGCDSILYALWTWDNTSPVQRNHQTIFQGLRQVERVILEAFDGEAYGPAEVWFRRHPSPMIAVQQFAASGESDRVKRQFMSDLPRRCFDRSLLMLCGESNIASTMRGTDEFYDPFYFNDWLDEKKVDVIWNPIHDYMRRYEMRRKRAYYSRNGRWVVSVWNQGTPGESHLPWTVYFDGEELTSHVDELPSPVASRPDIRIGIVDVPPAVR